MSEDQTEGALRAALAERADEADGSTLDATRIVSRARRRRLPAQLGAAAAAIVIVGGLGAGGFSAFGNLGNQSGSVTVADAPAEDSAASGGAAGESSKLAPADKVNGCTGQVAEVAPSQSGLTMSLDFPAEIPAGTTAVTGSVTITNSGTEAVTGSTSPSPAITLSQAGTVVWHSNGPVIMMAAIVDLAPGASMTLPATVTPVVCGVDDDALPSFRSDLPAAPEGEYDLSGIIYVSVDASQTTELDVVSSALTPVTIR